MTTHRVTFFFEGKEQKQRGTPVSRATQRAVQGRKSTTVPSLLPRQLLLRRLLERCRNPVPGRLRAFSRPRAPWETARAPATAPHRAAGMAGTKDLRFKAGDRVIAFTGEWSPGTIIGLHYREPSWAENMVAPYQIELDDGSLIYAPEDSDELVKAEGAEPWHKRQQRGMRQASIASLYPPKALHPDLFQPDRVDEWFVPDLRTALARWQETNDPRDIDVAAIPGLRLEAPGVVSFDCLTPEICDKILAESKHYSASGMPQRAPNSMNNYGVVLNEIGLRPTFDAMLRYVSTVGKGCELPPALKITASIFAPSRKVRTPRENTTQALHGGSRSTFLRGRRRETYCHRWQTR